MMGLRPGDTECDRFAVIMTAVYGLVMRKWGSQSALPKCAAKLAPIILVWSLLPPGGVSEDVSPLQGESCHETTQGWIPWPHGSTERVGRNETSTSNPLTSPWRWRQHGPPKLCYPTMSLNGITAHEIPKSRKTVSRLRRLINRFIYRMLGLSTDI
jgi:hypothetical protein